MIEEEKLAVVVISLNGEALAWFQWEEIHYELERVEGPPPRSIPTHPRRYPMRVVLVTPARWVSPLLPAHLRAFVEALEGVPEHVQERTFINDLKPEI